MIEIQKDPRYRLKTKLVRETANRAMADFDIDPEATLGVVFVGKRKAKFLNEKYRQMDYIPEVLSFPYHERQADGEYWLGEIVICFPSLREKAIRENQPLEEALYELVHHGVENLVLH